MIYDFNFKNCLLGAVKRTKNVDSDKHFDYMKECVIERRYYQENIFSNHI